MTCMAIYILGLEHTDTYVVILFMKTGHITHLRGAKLMKTSPWYFVWPIHTMNPTLGDPLSEGKFLISNLVSLSAPFIINLLPPVQGPSTRTMLTLVMHYLKVFPTAVDPLAGHTKRETTVGAKSA